MRVSACMIVKNEERNIARCINSFRDIVCETIVVDTGSTDQTVMIAKELKARVFHFTWINNFAAARNYAISRAKGDWIIFLDSDEYFAEGMAGNIPKLIERVQDSHDSIACKMINIETSNGKHLDEIIHIRIFKNNSNIHYVNPIHETLINNRKKLTAFLAEKKELLIYHTGYSLSNKNLKSERNLELLLQELPDAPRDPKIYHYISDGYRALENWEETVKYAQMFRQSGRTIFGCSIQSHQNMITAMFQLRYSTDDIMREIDIAAKEFPKNPVFYFYKAKLLYRDKKYDAAFSVYETTLRLQEVYNGIELNSMPQYIHQAYFYMGVISEHRNADEQAMDFYFASLKNEKYNAECFQRLFMLIRHQAPQDIIMFLNILYDKTDQNDLEFLVAQLANCEVATVFGYYANLRLKNHEKYDVLTIQMLLANGRYEEVLPNLLNFYKQRPDIDFAILIAVAALLGNNPNYGANCCGQLPPSIIKTTKMYTDKDGTLNSEDQIYYFQLLAKFILWADNESLDRLLSLSSHFENDVSNNIGTIFFNRKYYQTALRFYDQAISNGESPGEKYASYYFQKGYCLYKLKNYEAAVESFLQSYNCGYRDNDIYELLRWTLAVGTLSDALGNRANGVLRGAL
ncbi:hypothetical protein AXX12_08640 [Anaerosporomusa subterranea]|uniref:Glycosyltransferase 2-like domain-containing protein n=1 Tax=Anaerosporomusa subterranea TaxID=1794912 RepID=A0A154BRP5_ANASB|nr:glycosyltransferase family 2 protein [Anaerosporomusa subterranea]KYZ76490.1 hypothetical protein AXX12_08640 [Anaerosporomusa subterranea]